MSDPCTPSRPIFALFCLALALLTFACAPETAEVVEPPDAPDAADATTDAGNATDGGSCADQDYVVNPDAAQDVIENTTGFLRCTSGKYALCYYSGADPLPCTVEESGTSASCQCEVFTATEDKPMYVLMTSILNLCVYTETVEQCGEKGSDCYNMCNDHPTSPQCAGVTLPAQQEEAVVCDYIENGTFDPDAAFISTFSFEHVTAPGATDRFHLACNDTTGQYAGCMTASCSPRETDDAEPRYVSCDCPLWPADGSPVDYQFGRKCREEDAGDSSSPFNCKLEEGTQVWSAAYNPDGCPTLPSILSAGS